ncbi:MAG TPA: hypothetical protein ACHBX0_09730 [Arsenophonus sp.]
MKGLKLVIDFIGRTGSSFAKLINFLNQTTNGFWLLIPAAFALVKVFPLITKGIKTMEAALLTNPIFWVAAAIIAVIAVIEDLYVWMNSGKSVFGNWMEELGIFPDDMNKDD